MPSSVACNDNVIEDGLTVTLDIQCEPESCSGPGLVETRLLPPNTAAHWAVRDVEVMRSRGDHAFHEEPLGRW